MKAIQFEMYMLKTKNYRAVSRMKRVVKGRHWIQEPVHFFEYSGFCNIWVHYVGEIY